MHDTCSADYLGIPKDTHRAQEARLTGHRVQGRLHSAQDTGQRKHMVTHTHTHIAAEGGEHLSLVGQLCAYATLHALCVCVCMRVCGWLGGWVCVYTVTVGFYVTFTVTVQ